MVTVTYRDTNGLRRTLQSLEDLVREAGPNAEVLVVDGGSGVEIAQVAEEFPWARVHSDRDDGIYDAMNKGLTRSTGTFIWFLNGGDECLIDSWSRLSSELTESPGSIILGGYVLKIGAHRITKTSRSPSYVWHGLPTSHQAIFYPGDVARNNKYDVRFKMSADYQFTAQLLVAGVPAKRSELLVALFNMDGFSSNYAHLVAREAAIVQRDILKCPLHLRAFSRLRHFASRNARRMQARFWSVS